jgi:hypothetical protein
LTGYYAIGKEEVGEMSHEMRKGGERISLRGQCYMVGLQSEKTGSQQRLMRTEVIFSIFL